MLRLEILSDGGVSGAEEPDADVVVIGSSPHADVRIDAEGVAAEHLVLVTGDVRVTARPATVGAVTLVEHASGSTTLEDPEARAALANGDVLVLGPPDGPRLRVCLKADAEPEHVLDVRGLSSLAESRAPAERQEALLGALASLHRAVAEAEVLSDVLAAVADGALAVVPRATHATVVLRDPPEDDDAAFVPILTRVRAQDGSPQNADGSLRVVRSVFRKVVRDRTAVVAADAAGSDLSSDSLLGAGILSTIGLPLWRADRITGVLQLDSRDAPAVFEPEDVDALAAFAWSATLAIDNARLIGRLRAAEERLESENDFLRSRSRAEVPKTLVGEAPAIQALSAQIDKVAPTRATVLVLGETGTGKELVARAVHDRSPRRSRLFVAQNCAALPEQLLESELFGHRRGAFTGATEDKKGLFELADGGTLFLDEIGEMPQLLQAKLLRVLQDGEVRSLGATRPKRVDVRIVAATHRDLDVEVREGRFREDLYYRLAVFPLAVPPLRERPEDIPRLAATFLERTQKEIGKSIAGLAEDALELLRAYEWPGNVRELENEIQRLVIQADADAFVSAELLSPRVRKLDDLVTTLGADHGTLKERVEQVERYILKDVLRAHDNNKTSAAKELGITREGLHKKLKQLGIA